MSRDFLERIERARGRIADALPRVRVIAACSGDALLCRVVVEHVDVVAGPWAIDGEYWAIVQER